MAPKRNQAPAKSGEAADTASSKGTDASTPTPPVDGSTFPGEPAAPTVAAGLPPDSAIVSVTPPVGVGCDAASGRHDGLLPFTVVIMTSRAAMGDDTFSFRYKCSSGDDLQAAKVLRYMGSGVDAGTDGGRHYGIATVYAKPHARILYRLHHVSGIDQNIASLRSSYHEVHLGSHCVAVYVKDEFNAAVFSNDTHELRGPMKLFWFSVVLDCYIRRGETSARQLLDDPVKLLDACSTIIHMWPCFARCIIDLPTASAVLGLGSSRLSAFLALVALRCYRGNALAFDYSRSMSALEGFDAVAIAEAISETAKSFLALRRSMLQVFAGLFGTRPDRMSEESWEENKRKIALPLFVNFPDDRDVQAWATQCACRSEHLLPFATKFAKAYTKLMLLRIRTVNDFLREREVDSTLTPDVLVTALKADANKPKPTKDEVLDLLKLAAETQSVPLLRFLLEDRQYSFRNMTATLDRYDDAVWAWINAALCFTAAVPERREVIRAALLRVEELLDLVVATNRAPAPSSSYALVVTTGSGIGRSSLTNTEPGATISPFETLMAKLQAVHRIAHQTEQMFEQEPAEVLALLRPVFAKAASCLPTHAIKTDFLSRLRVLTTREFEGVPDHSPVWDRERDAVIPLIPKCFSDGREMRTAMTSAPDNFAALDPRIAELVVLTLKDDLAGAVDGARTAIRTAAPDRQQQPRLQAVLKRALEEVEVEGPSTMSIDETARLNALGFIRRDDAGAASLRRLVDEALELRPKLCADASTKPFSTAIALFDTAAALSRGLVKCLTRLRLSSAELDVLVALNVPSALTILHPAFDWDGVAKKAKQALAKAASTANAALRCVQHVLSRHPVFELVVPVLEGDLQRRLDGLHDCSLDTVVETDDNASDAFGRIAVRFDEALRSELFKRVWEPRTTGPALPEAEAGERLDPETTPADVVLELEAIEHQVRQDYAAVVTRVLDGTMTLEEVGHEFCLPAGALEVQAAWSEGGKKRFQTLVKDHVHDAFTRLNAYVINELLLAGDVVPEAVAAKDVDRAAQHVTQAVRGLTLLDDVRATRDLVQELCGSADVAASPALRAFELFIKTFQRRDAPLVDCAAAFTALDTATDQALTWRVVGGFAGTLLALIREGVLPQLRQEPDFERLNAIVQRRLQELTDERSADILQGFHALAEVVSDEGTKTWDAFTLQQIRDPMVVVGFLDTACGIKPSLDTLRGNVKALKQIRDDNDDGQVMHRVLRLLTRGGIRVRIADGAACDIAALVPRPANAASSSAAGNDAVTEATLTEWTAQLAFIGQAADGAPDSDGDDETDEVMPAAAAPDDADGAAVAVDERPLRMSSPAERRRIVQLFTALMDVLADLRAEVEGFVASGHPNSYSFFDPELIVRFESAPAVTVLRDVRRLVVQELKRQRVEWTDVVLPRVRERFPVIGYMPRSVLARTVNAALSRDAADLARIASIVSESTAPLDVADVEKALDETVGDGSESDDDGDDVGGYEKACEAVARVLTAAFRDSRLHDDRLNTLPAVPAKLAATHSTVTRLAANLDGPFAVLRFGARAVDQGSRAAKLPLAAAALCGASKRRAPTAMETLLCEADTPVEDVDDFAQRWVIASDASSAAGVIPASALFFTVVNAERLSAAAANALVAQLRRNASNGQQPGVPFTVLCNGHCDVSRNLRAYEHEILDEAADELAALSRWVLHCHLDGRVVSSALSLGGKTSSILRRVAATGDAYVALPVSAHSSVQQVVDLVGKTLEGAAALRGDAAKAMPVTLHFNVSPDATAAFATKLFMQLAVLRQLTDRSGRIVSLPKQVSLVIELPSDTYATRTPLLDLFREDVPILIRTERFRFHVAATNGDDSSIPLYTVAVESDDVLERGAKALCQFDQASTAGRMAMAYGSHVTAQNPPAPDALTAAVSRLSGQGGAARSPYPFFRFAAHQCANIVADDQSVFFHDTGDVGMSKLLFHFVALSMRVAQWMALEGVPPKQRSDEGDDERLARMRPFSAWSREQMLVTQPGEHALFSLNENARVLTDMTSADPDPRFKQFMREQHTLQQMDRGALQQLCSGVTSTPYEAQHLENHPLKRIMSLCSTNAGFTEKLFGKLQRIHDNETQAHFYQQTVQPALVAKCEERIAEAVADGYELLESVGAGVPPPAHGGDARDQGRHFTASVTEWLQSIFGTSDSRDSAPFVLTVDLLVRLVSMKMRVACGVPVVWIGESGCGKTHTVEAFARVTAMHDPHVINVNGGVTAPRLLESLGPAIEEATAVPGRTIVVQLDEVNTMDDTWTAKELVLDRTILGRRIPENIVFVAIMNPTRRRTAAQQAAMDAVDSLGGLNYAAAVSDNGGSGAGDAHQQKDAATNGGPRRRFVYQVRPCADAIMAYAWDFGSAATNFSSLETAEKVTQGRTRLPTRTVAGAVAEVTDEVLFAETILHWIVRKQLAGKFPQLDADFRACQDRDGNKAHWAAFRSVVCALLGASQAFLRETFHGDGSVVSMRDMVRAVKFIPVIMQCYRVRADVSGIASAEAKPGFAALTASVHISLILVYYLRLEATTRQKYLKRMMAEWGNARAIFNDVGPEFLPTPENAYDMYGRTFDELAQYLCACLPQADGLAVNEALKENVLSMFAAFMRKQPHFIVGRPGSSKTRSVESLITATDPNTTAIRCEFFRAFGVRIQKFVLQCSRHTTAEDVLRVARTAAKFQDQKDDIVCVFVLEEVGVTIGSRHNPLTMLHSLIDHGVLIETAGGGGRKHVRIPILGVSNWMLDGSKMNRATITHRGTPSVEDLVLTAEELSRGSEAGALPELHRFARVFHQFVLSVGGGTRGALYQWFYGMRDFYTFVTTLQHLRLIRAPREHAGAAAASRHRSEKRVSYDAIMWALRIAFGGMPSCHQAAEHALYRELFNAFRNLNDVCEPLSAFKCVADITAASTNNSEDTQAGDGWASSEAMSRPGFCELCATMRFGAFHTHARKAAVSTTPAEGDTATTPNNAGGDAAAREDELRAFNRFAIPFEKKVACSLHTASELEPPALDLEVMAYALANPSARHLLLFTEDNSSMRLLFDLGLVDESRATFIFGSASNQQGAVSQSKRSADLARVKACLKMGGVLILNDATHLYETLLDPLNLNYTKEGTSHRCHLPTATGYSQSVRVDPRFRCIILCEESKASLLLPPFLNRFMKARLSFRQMLSVAQANRLRDLVDAWTLRRRRVGAAAAAAPDADDASEEASKLDLLALVIPGYSTESIPSALLLADRELAAAHADEDASPDDVPSAEFRLAQCVSLWSLELTRVALKASDDLTDRNAEVLDNLRNRMLTYRGQPRTQTFFSDAMDAWACQPNAQHFFVTTQQFSSDFERLAAEVEDFFARQNGDEPEVRMEARIVRPSPTSFALDIGAPGADDALRRLLRELREAPVGGNEADADDDDEPLSSAFLLLYFDANAAASVNGLLFDVASRKLGPRRHVVVVALVSPELHTRTTAASSSSSSPASGYKLSIVPNWVQLHVDEIVPSSPALPRDTTLEEIRQPAIAANPETFGAWGALLLRQSVPRLLQDILLATPVHQECRLQTAQLESFASTPLFADMCLALSGAIASAAPCLTDGEWITQSLRHVHDAGSLRLCLTLFLTRVWSRAFAAAFASLLADGVLASLIGAAAGSRHGAALFSAADAEHVIRTAVLPAVTLRSDPTDLATTLEPNAADNVLGVASRVYGTAGSRRFPLAAEIASAVERAVDNAGGAVDLKALLRANFPVLSAHDGHTSAQLLRAYVCDVFRAHLLVGSWPDALGEPRQVTIDAGVALLAMTTKRPRRGGLSGKAEEETGAMTPEEMHHAVLHAPTMVASVTQVITHLSSDACGDDGQRALAAFADAGGLSRADVAGLLLTHRTISVASLPHLRRVIEAVPSAAAAGGGRGEGVAAFHEDPCADVDFADEPPSAAAPDDDDDDDDVSAGDVLEAPSAEAGSIDWPLIESVALVADGERQAAFRIIDAARRSLVQGIRLLFHQQQPDGAAAALPPLGAPAVLLLASTLFDAALSPTATREVRGRALEALTVSLTATPAGAFEGDGGTILRTLTAQTVVRLSFAVGFEASSLPTLQPAELALIAQATKRLFASESTDAAPELLGARGAGMALISHVDLSVLSKIGAVPDTDAADASLGSAVVLGLVSAGFATLGRSIVAAAARRGTDDNSRDAGPGLIVSGPELRQLSDLLAALVADAATPPPTKHQMLCGLLRELTAGGADVDSARAAVAGAVGTDDVDVVANSDDSLRSFIPAPFLDDPLWQAFELPVECTGPLDSIPDYARAVAALQPLLDQGGTPSAAFIECDDAGKAAALAHTIVAGGAPVAERLQPMLAVVASQDLRPWVADAAQLRGVRLDDRDPATASAMADLLLHLQVAFKTGLTAAHDAGEGPGLLAYLGRLCGPYDPDALLPAVTASQEADIILSDRPESQLWHCPNGHHYTTDGCPTPASAGTCGFVDARGRVCGAPTGGNGGRPFPGVVRRGRVADFLTRPEVFTRTTGYKSTADGKPVRNLTRPAFYSGRVLLLASLLASRFSFPDAHVLTVTEYADDLRAALAEVRTALFPATQGLTATILWVHALVSLRLAAPQPEPANRDAFEAALNRAVGTAATAATLAQEYEALRTSNVSDGAQRFKDCVAGRGAAAAAAPWWAGAAFGFHPTPSDAEALRRAVDSSDVVRTFAERLPCLSDGRTAALASMLRLVDQAQRHAARGLQLSRDAAKAMPLGEFLRGAPPALREAFAEFRRCALGHVILYAHRDGCTVIRDAFAHLIGDGCTPAQFLPYDTAHAAVLLPGTEDESLFLPALYRAVTEANGPAMAALAQNDVVDAVRRALGHQPPSAAHRLFALDAKMELISAGLGVKTVVPRAVAKISTALGLDAVPPQLIGVLERRLIVDTRAALVPELPREIPPHRYTDHPTPGHLDDFMNRLQQHVPAAAVGAQTLPPAAADFYAGLRTVPAMRQAMHSLLLLHAVFAARQMAAEELRPTTTTAIDAIRVDASVLSGHQHEALAHLAANRHIVAATALAMLPTAVGILWDPESLPDAVAPQQAARRNDAASPLPEAVAAAAGVIAASPKVAHVLAVLRYIAMTQLPSAEAAALQWPVDTVVQPLDADDTLLGGDDKLVSALSDCVLRDVPAIVHAVEKRLGARAFSYGAGGSPAEGDEEEGAAAATRGDYVAAVALEIRRAFLRNSASAKVAAAASASSRVVPQLALAPAGTQRPTSAPRVRSARRHAAEAAPQETAAARLPTIQWGSRVVPAK